jgi:hypothetical protein
MQMQSLINCRHRAAFEEQQPSAMRLMTDCFRPELSPNMTKLNVSNQSDSDSPKAIRVSATWPSKPMATRRDELVPSIAHSTESWDRSRCSRTFSLSFEA